MTGEKDENVNAFLSILVISILYYLDIDECATNVCQNEAFCEDGVNSYTCVCAPGYEGTFCETGIENFGIYDVY